MDGPSAGGEEAEGGSAGHYISSWLAPVQSVARRGARGKDGGGEWGGGLEMAPLQTEVSRVQWHRKLMDGSYGGLLGQDLVRA